MKRQRRHFSGTEKVAILKRHLLEKVPISDLCDELDIYPNQWVQSPCCARMPDFACPVEDLRL